jgi:acetylornithine/succinyldiaminopimelate/putrescine aminotransferase
MSCDNEATRGFGPLMPGHLKVDFGDAEALEKIFKGFELFHTLFFVNYQYILLSMTYI